MAKKPSNDELVYQAHMAGKPICPVCLELMQVIAKGAHLTKWQCEKHDQTDITPTPKGDNVIPIDE